ncbi:shikimate kinase [Hoeflea prorocentri]|uniref:Shikimate kinase n=1 Tax=Hoeflea prorocentri TaxID=1922333 RepID=A0A9X3ZJW7_9HYPH|nr:shikimate kinase [Hoeflea prorocentri]MCY6383533.1 shikimate kinase [Hoeflea prorocentri]MDA5401333.1 shikimate kinase [Hoeflea prorocentri]
MMTRASESAHPQADEARACLGSRAVAFVGLMGAGKSVIGRMSAQAMRIPFVDSDHEIEQVSRMSISDLFAQYGEAEFRALEARVIKRLLQEGPMVLSTGGGAFMQAPVRDYIGQSGLSLWLKADLDVLWERVKRRSHRPLLQTDNPEATLSALLDERYPVYAMADLVVQSRDAPKETIVDEVLDAIIKNGPQEAGDRKDG